MREVCVVVVVSVVVYGCPAASVLLCVGSISLVYAPWVWEFISNAFWLFPGMSMFVIFSNFCYNVVDIVGLVVV